ncbi:hypothetical protein [Bradyrhizobium sp. USDA 4473]
MRKSNGLSSLTRAGGQSGKLTKILWYDGLGTSLYALGYHDITKDGQPISMVFVKTTLAASQRVSTTASHELLEMLIDPGARLWAKNVGGKLYAYEMCAMPSRARNTN